jgi:hypothetical protein
MKNAGGYSIRDIYGSGPVLSTTEQTIPENEEREEYNNEVAEGPEGKKQVVSKGTIWGALGMMAALLIVVNFIE